MTKKSPIPYLSLWVATTKSLAKPEVGRRFESAFRAMPPELVPTKFDFVEPVRKRFTLDKAQDLLRVVWGGADTSPIFRFTGAVTGEMHLLCGPQRGRLCNYIAIDLNYTKLTSRGLFATATDLFERLLETCEIMHACMRLYSAPPGGGWDESLEGKRVDVNGILVGSDGGIKTNLSCLPSALYWITVLGKPYVELVGADRLLDLDLYKSWIDSKGRVWLQLAEAPEQMHDRRVQDRVNRALEELRQSDVAMREPVLDRSEIQPEPIDDDPYSTRSSSYSVVIGNRTSLKMSYGFSRQIVHRLDLMAVVDTLLDLVLRTGGYVEPFGVALAEDDELLDVRIRDLDRWTIQEQADLIVERLARLREQRPIKATGACWYGRGDVPGHEEETTAFKLHIESAEGDAYVVYLPFEEKNGKREYGTLVIEPGERVVFADAP